MSAPALASLFQIDSIATLSRGRTADPAEVLYLLRYGAWTEATCAPQRPFGTGRWLRIDALPAPDDTRAGSFEDMLTMLISAGTVVEIVVDHTAGEGLTLLLGAERSVLERASRVMAPNIDSRPAGPPSQQPTWHQVGMVFRLLNESEAGESAGRRRVGLLERLSIVEGAWRVNWRIAGSDLGQLDELTSRIEDIEEAASERKAFSRQTSSTATTTVVSSGWTRVEKWLGHLHHHLALGRSVGSWRVTSYASSPDAATLDSVVAACRSAVPVTPTRIFATDVCGIGTAADPAPTSVMTTFDIAAMVAAPDGTIPGLAIRRAAPPGRRLARRSAVVRIGEFWGTDVPCALDLEDFEGHAFISGTTGSGKTATVTRILAEAWNEHRIPCLIIDPVKDDYSEAAGCFRGGLRVVRGATLCMNILQPWPGVAADVHIGRVSQAFRGAFSMPSPSPYVVMQMFDTLLTQRGGAGDSASLTDLKDMLEDLVRRMGYAEENTSNIRAAVLTRLNLLLSPVRAHRFAWPDSSQLRGLLDKPTVVTLADLGDDEERSFVVLLIAMAVWSAARVRVVPAAVEHLLVLEEAHRVIPEVSHEASGDENGSARMESAALLTSMLAEVRSFGEQVIVVDQSPAKVASDVVRNTNLKIAHRIVHPGDQAHIGGAIGLAAQDSAVLGELRRGQVIISTRSEPAPQTVAIKPAVAISPRTSSILNPPPAPQWPCCKGTASPSAQHYLAWQLASSAAQHMSLFLVAIRFGDGDGAALRQHVFGSLLRLSSMRDLNRECLAWTGIRHILANERAIGLVRSPLVFHTALETSYSAWATKQPADAALGKSVRLAAEAYTARCDVCGELCGVRVPAQILLAGQPRTGLRALTVSTRREELPAIESSVARDVRVLSGLLGEDAGWRLQRCQIAQAVDHAQLDRSISSELERNIKSRLSSGGAAAP